MHRAAQGHPDFAVFSGRTHYGNKTAWQRVLNLLGRSFDDLGRSGETDMISNHAALYRTGVLKQFPYPEAPTPFLSSQLRNRQIVEAGHKCFSDRNALSRHAIGGLGLVWDVGKHSGYSSFVYQGGAANATSCASPRAGRAMTCTIPEGLAPPISSRWSGRFLL